MPKFEAPKKAYKTTNDQTINRCSLVVYFFQINISATRFSFNTNIIEIAYDIHSSKYLNKITGICFTWTLRKDVLSLICKVDHLIYDVAILGENGEERASCLMPSIVSHCVSYLTHGYISQDIRTNTTALIVSSFDIDNPLHRNWTCRHGTGLESATAEVTVILNTCMYKHGVVIKNGTLSKQLCWSIN